MAMKARLNQNGMTLIELLAVIVILGIIASIGVVSISTVIKEQKDRAFVANALALKESVSLYIQQELASGSTLPEKITYKHLYDAMLIEQIKDPDTGEYLEPSDSSYVTLVGKTPTAVCLKGEKRKLCSKNNVEGPIPISELSTDLLTDN